MNGILRDQKITRGPPFRPFKKSYGQQKLATFFSVISKYLIMTISNPLRPPSISFPFLYLVAQGQVQERAVLGTFFAPLFSRITSSTLTNYPWVSEGDIPASYFILLPKKGKKHVKCAQKQVNISRNDEIHKCFLLFSLLCPRSPLIRGNLKN